MDIHLFFAFPCLSFLPDILCRFRARPNILSKTAHVPGIIIRSCPDHNHAVMDFKDDFLSRSNAETFPHLLWNNQLAPVAQSHCYLHIGPYTLNCMIKYILSYKNYISMSINIYYAISNKLLISDIMVVSMNTVKEKDGFGNRKFL